MSSHEDTVVQLLREIRAGQQEQLEHYRETTSRALQIQQAAVDMQRRTARLYRIVVAVAAILAAGLILYLSTLPT